MRAALALVEDVNASGKDLIDEFWPGGLTLIMRANRSLAWDLGETKGTVAVRMPLHPVTIDVLRETGPLAVSSANRRCRRHGAHGSLGSASSRCRSSCIRTGANPSEGLLIVSGPMRP